MLFFIKIIMGMYVYSYRNNTNIFASLPPRDIKNIYTVATTRWLYYCSFSPFFCPSFLNLYFRPLSGCTSLFTEMPNEGGIQLVLNKYI